jgi:hypothetical protein
MTLWAVRRPGWSGVWVAAKVKSSQITVDTRNMAAQPPVDGLSEGHYDLGYAAAVRLMAEKVAGWA